MRLSRAIIEAEKTNVAASKKNAKLFGWRWNRSTKGSPLGRWATPAARPLNSAAATGMDPYDVARMRPLASARADWGTSLGTLASLAGRKNREIVSWMKAIAYSRPMFTNGTTAINPARARSQVTMIVRRWRRSATTPPTGAAKIGGTSRRTSTAATAVWFPWVSRKAVEMKASVATQSPSEETPCPMRSRRNPVERTAARNPPPNAPFCSVLLMAGASGPSGMLCGRERTDRILERERLRWWPSSLTAPPTFRASWLGSSASRWSQCI